MLINKLRIINDRGSNGGIKEIAPTIDYRRFLLFFTVSEVIL